MKEQTLQKKQAVIDEIKEHIQNADSVVIAEYRGLNVTDVSELRSRVRQAGSGYKVYKNTMVGLALKDLGYAGYEALLTGPNAFVFSNGDMVTGPKLAKQFSQEHDALQIKAGLMDGKLLSKEEVLRLADMPTKEVLLGMVLRGLQGPIAGLANVCQATIRSVVYALNAVKEQKEQEAA